jgi:PAS domain S-box-containing protein
VPRLPDHPSSSPLDDLLNPAQKILLEDYVFENNPNGIVITNNEGMVLWCNTAYLNLSGYAFEEVVGHKLRLHQSIKQDETFYRRIWTDLFEGTIFCGNLTNRRKDGSFYEREYTIIPFRSDQSITHLVVATHEVTNPHPDEVTLSTVEWQFRSLMESISLIGVMVDTKGRITFCNACLLGLTGWKAEEVVNQNWFDLFVPPENREILRDVIFKRNIASGEIPARFEGEIITRQGERKLIVWNNTVLREGNGAIAGVASLGEDITKRRQEEALLELQRSALEAAANAIVITTPDGLVEWVNPAFTTFTGYGFEEVFGQNLRLLKSGKHDDKFYADLWETVSSGKTWHGEIINRRKDGALYTEDMTVTPMINVGGKIEHFIAVKQDVTERKQIEALFLRAQRMESIGSLAGGVAQDLNNVLAPIVMSIEILKAISESPQAMKILESIEVSAKRGADIVRQVLSIARGLECERIEVQPKHLLKDLEKFIKDTFPKNIRLHFSIPDDVWTILGDPTQIHQVLLNLCVNAREAMPNGGSLTIEVENCVLDEPFTALNAQAKPGRYVNISLVDSGNGISKDILAKIFDPFFTTKGLHTGAGLGLSTVMAIVRSHDGIINVYSEPGKGTTFEVYLPALEISHEARDEQAKQAGLPRGKGETILVVDDETSILTITRQTLQAFGYNVLTATDGADAMAVYTANKNQISVVLTDMMMPLMDGPATIQALTRINPAIKIIATSGINAHKDAVGGTGSSVRHFLTKPYTAGTLLKTVRAILDEV